MDSEEEGFFQDESPGGQAALRRARKARQPRAAPQQPCPDQITSLQQSIAQLE